MIKYVCVSVVIKVYVHIFEQFTLPAVQVINPVVIEQRIQCQNK